MASEIQYGQGLEVEQVVLHNLHPNLTVTLTNIGQIHRQRGESTEALKVYKKAIAIQVKSIGETHPTRSLARLNPQSVHSSTGIGPFIKPQNPNEFISRSQKHENALETLPSISLSPSKHVAFAPTTHDDSRLPFYHPKLMSPPRRVNWMNWNAPCKAIVNQKS